MTFESLKPELIAIINATHESDALMLTEVCNLLLNNLPAYDWVGFYFANHDERMLHLKAFAGEPTSHTEIPYGKGICGQVAESDSNFVVDDVAAEDNYISCSIYVKSEIVVPLFKNGENIGQIDIDSHTPNAFTQEDEQFLEWLNKSIAETL